LDDCLVIHPPWPDAARRAHRPRLHRLGPRAAALDACAFLMDGLKTRAPFWKLEETPSGERWVEARETDDAAAARWSKADYAGPISRKEGCGEMISPPPPRYFCGGGCPSADAILIGEGAPCASGMHRRKVPLGRGEIIFPTSFPQIRGPSGNVGYWWCGARRTESHEAEAQQRRHHRRAP
jgi:hypothetical protein